MSTVKSYNVIDNCIYKNVIVNLYLQTWDDIHFDSGSTQSSVLGTVLVTGKEI